MLKHSLRSKRFLSSKRFYYALLARLIARKLAREGKRVIRREGEWRKGNLSLLSNTLSPPPPPPPLLFFLFLFCFFLFRFAFQPSRNNSSRERGAGSVVLVSIT